MMATKRYSALLWIVLTLGVCSMLIPAVAAQGAITDLTASDDAYVRGGTYQHDNHGALGPLLLKDSPDPTNQYDRRIFLKFDLASLGAVAVTSATLTFTVVSIEQDLPRAPLHVANTTDDWTASAVTWTTQPALQRDLAHAMLVTPGPHALDVTAYVRDQIVGDKHASFVLLDTTAFDHAVTIASTEDTTGAPTLRVHTEAEPPLLAPPAVGKHNGPFFQVPCPTSHRSHDDPMVFPGTVGATHEHQFFGNRTTDAASTHTTLLGGATNCRVDPADTAAYWIPTLYDAAHTLQSPYRVRAYYYANTSNRAALQTFPAGLRVIAGDSKATAPQPDGVIRWLCRDRSNQSTEKPLAATNPPRCVRDQFLSLMIRFPNCLALYRDGTPMLDSSNHRRHMAYADANQACPPSHPLRVPKLRLSITYETPGYAGGSFTLGGPSGAHHVLTWHAMHADFWNAWDQAALDEYVTECLKTGQTDRPAGCNVVRDRASS